MKPIKLVTFGQTAVAFAETEEVMACELGIPERVFYSGPLDDLSRRTAKKIAQLHPNFGDYQEYAMAILWKGSGVYRRGTEDVVAAITSYAREEDNWMVAWKPLEQE